MTCVSSSRRKVRNAKTDPSKRNWYVKRFIKVDTVLNIYIPNLWNCGDWSVDEMLCLKLFFSYTVFKSFEWNLVHIIPTASCMYMWTPSFLWGTVRSKYSRVMPLVQKNINILTSHDKVGTYLSQSMRALVCTEILTFTFVLMVNFHKTDRLVLFYGTRVTLVL